MSRLRTRYLTVPRGGSTLWQGDEAGAAILRAEFFGPSAPANQQIAGTAGFEDADAFGAGTVSGGGAGSQTVIQTAGFVDVDAFGLGALARRITGSGFVDADAFGLGAAGIRIAGAGFADPQQFGVGALSARLQGTGFLDPDQFGAGALSSRIAGTGFADADAFGAGAVSSGQPSQPVAQVAGFVDPDAFGAGAAGLRVVQVAGHEDADGFGGGLIAVVGGVVRGPRRASSPRPQPAETRPGELNSRRAPAYASQRTTNTTTRPADAAATRNAA